LLAERLRAMVPEHQLKGSGKKAGADKTDRMDEAA
jgi:chemotaxis protein MotA